jgi:hypothetical protein
MSFNAPFFGLTTGFEKSGAVEVAKVARGAGGFGVGETLLIANPDKVTAKNVAGKLSFAGNV